MANIQKFPAVVAGAFRGWFEKIVNAGIVQKIRQWAATIFAKIVERIPEEKRRLVLLCACGGLALLLVIGLSLAAGGNSVRSRPAAASAQPRQTPIPPDEIFLPDEPDFVPSVLLERERRSVWTAEDAAPFWQDPLKNGEEPWRKRIETIADDILEHVP